MISTLLLSSLLLGRVKFWVQLRVLGQAQGNEIAPNCCPIAEGCDFWQWDCYAITLKVALFPGPILPLLALFQLFRPGVFGADGYAWKVDHALAFGLLEYHFVLGP